MSTRQSGKKEGISYVHNSNKAEGSEQCLPGVGGDTESQYVLVIIRVGRWGAGTARRANLQKRNRKRNLGEKGCDTIVPRSTAKEKRKSLRGLIVKRQMAIQEDTDGCGAIS